MLPEIERVEQHHQRLREDPAAYRPELCGHCAKAGLHRHGHYERNAPIQLANYPPYHSKYNLVERLCGILENHWRGELLSSVKKALGPA